jgi:AcrR family transcriptional regulator
VEPLPERQSKPTAGSWQWSRTAGTRRTLLDAAASEFVKHGFSEASIADLVENSGVSVGSLYHHFGSKSDLFVALWQEYFTALSEASRGAVAEAGRLGVTDPFDLLVAGARAYLEGCWERRDLTVLFLASGDAPPGFEAVRRQQNREWLAGNDKLLKLSDSPVDRLYLLLLTSVIGEGGIEVAACETQAQAKSVIDAVIEYVRRLMVGGAWTPPPAKRASAH